MAQTKATKAQRDAGRVMMRDAMLYRVESAAADISSVITLYYDELEGSERDALVRARRTLDGLAERMREQDGTDGE